VVLPVVREEVHAEAAAGSRRYARLAEQGGEEEAEVAAVPDEPTPGDR
jgi:hypothetical protein